MIAVARPMQFRPTENKGKLCELSLNEPQSPSACPGNLVKQMPAGARQEEQGRQGLQ